MRLSPLPILLSILCSATASHAQPGCTDPQATNFNAGATLNDGSCVYSLTYYTPVFRATIDAQLKEISGLHRADGEWWAHNDSGYEPDFYSLDPESGGILKKISLKDAHNRDWEDVCSDATALYFGDFGNNTNDRQNLGIYRVPFSAIGNGSNQSVQADEYTFIPFAYPDQTDFSTISQDSAVFDCEAMIYQQGKLHLFTKNRRDYKTTHYAMPAAGGVVENVETFDVQGLITGASLSPDSQLLVLAGYDLRGLPTVFCWLLWDWPAGTDLFFSGNKRRIELGSALIAGQVESIGFESNRSGYIANETTEYNGFLFVSQSTRAFDFSPWAPPTVSTTAPERSDSPLRVYPNPTDGMVFLDADAGLTENVRVEVLNSMGVLVAAVEGLPKELDLRALPSGMYLIRVIQPGVVGTQMVRIR